MSVRLLLDEMFHTRIASELTARGHDCLAVAADSDAQDAAVDLARFLAAWQGVTEDSGHPAPVLRGRAGLLRAITP